MSAITRREQLTGELETFMPKILAALPWESQKKQDRFKSALLSMASDANIAGCTTASIVVSAYRAAQVALVPNSPLQHCAIVPRKEKGVLKATLEIMYRGFIELARRTGAIADVVAEVVYENDDFERRGHFQEPRHRRWDERTPDGEPGEFRGVYCVTLWKDGHVSTTWMTAADVLKRRNAAAQKYVWDAWFDEMARKSIIKHAAKTWPLDESLALAIEADDLNAQGKPLPVPDCLPAPSDGDPLIEQLRKPVVVKEDEPGVVCMACGGDVPDGTGKTNPTTGEAICDACQIGE